MPRPAWGVASFPHVLVPLLRRESTIVKELSPVPPDVLAVEARDLRKEFVRKDRRHGKRRVAAALVRLAREARIVRVEYRKPTRKPGERWELAHDAMKSAA